MEQEVLEVARRQVAALRSFGLSRAADEIVAHYPGYSEPIADEPAQSGPGYAVCG